MSSEIHVNASQKPARGTLTNTTIATCKLAYVTNLPNITTYYTVSYTITHFANRFTTTSVLPSVLWHCWFVGRKGIQPVKNMGDDGGWHSIVQIEWHPAGWSVCLPLLIFPRTIKSRSSLLALAHPGGPRKRAVKWLWWWCFSTESLSRTCYTNRLCFSPHSGR